MSDMSVAFVPSPGQPLCFTSTETKETVSVGKAGEEDFLERREEREEEDFSEGEEGEGDRFCFFITVFRSLSQPF
jgi:hypothetical protein